MNIAVLVNLRARKGTEGIGGLVRRLLPRARVALTRSVDEARDWISDHLRHDPPNLLLAGGGDGTITGLLNELRMQGVALPAIGVLPLGTGNAWARVTGAPRPSVALKQIAALGERLPPLRPFSLVRVDGKVAPFAGTGWDAEMIQDFKNQLAAAGPLKSQQAGLRGYLTAMFTRTVPRHLFGEGNPQVSVYNVGEPALTMDAHGAVQPIPHGGPGALLYRGPAGVAGAATTPEWGFGFKAFPFAQAVPHRLSVRVYGAGVMEATRNMFRLWRGEHPLPHMHDFFVQRLRMDFDREVPFQMGGDVLGMRRSIEFDLAEENVQLVDWHRVSRMVAV
ncbi:diacylglycerol kinase [Corallococcus sp. H22C18031201]|uniref:diacylglycerol/lipid kinase family protein n=1 Tax=Citreicoccus inhibens TaxID=2849499 RepID=UPI000E72A7A5|nr:diacylglycerol kinase family protein [Citreicoccus inhibens]MBU8896702.1 diacylglycerol kinase [Citreicoccus inhibens]RJS21994.1 diacylglycerol kinase [Corallococcus sp. H22C18031201]